MSSMFRVRQVLLRLAPAVLCAGPFAGAADTDWRDVESRVQYAWYTEDARDLTAVEKRLTALPDTDPQRSYYLTLIQLREAQITVDEQVGGREAASCISSADAALALRPTDAEVLA